VRWIKTGQARQLPVAHALAKLTESRLALGRLPLGVSERALLASVLALIGLFLLLTLRTGQSWGDDFAMYIAHARNIVTGGAYGDTGYIPNPLNVPGPPTYPPIYPLLLAPVYHWFGIDFEAMKVQTVLLLLAALAVIYQCVRRELPALWSLGLVAAVGLNPWIWECKDEVMSDVPFLLFCFLTLWLAQRFAQMPVATVFRQVTRGALLGLTFYLAYGTRSIGLVLIPTVFAADLLRTRRIGLTSMISILFFGGFWLAQNALLHTDGQYGRFITLDPHWVGYNAWMYLRSLSVFWKNGYSEALRGLVFGVVLLLGAAGYVQQVRRKAGVLEIFPVFYFGTLCVYWVGHLIQQRYVLPLLPLVVYFALIAVRAGLARLPANVATVLPAVLLAVLATQYVARYTTVQFGPLQEGVYKAETVALLDFVRRETAPGDIVVFGKPRLLALYTGRPSASYYGNHSDAELWAFLLNTHARYVIAAKPDALAAEMDYEEPRLLSHFIERAGSGLRRVYSNADFDVYAVEQMAPGRS